MAISRRTFVAAALATVGTSTARAVVTDATGRTSRRLKSCARVSCGPARRHPALYARARFAARVAAGQSARRMRLYAARCLHAPRGRTDHRPRQHGQSRSRAQRSSRTYSRCRLTERHLRLACRTGAGADRNSLCAARRPLRGDARTYRKLGELIGGRTKPKSRALRPSKRSKRSAAGSQRFPNSSARASITPAARAD